MWFRAESQPLPYALCSHDSILCPILSAFVKFLKAKGQQKYRFRGSCLPHDSIIKLIIDDYLTEKVDSLLRGIVHSIKKSIFKTTSPYES
jgi:hypothetical protein